ncbi:MAG: efflux RND transporter periplasmic adaptor subunit [Bacteroidota bacterium]
MNIKSKILLMSFCALILACNNGKESNNEHENHSTQEQKVYTCPMHPEIIRNEPGQCPICGMDLVEKTTDGQKANNKDLELLLKPTNQYVISQVNTASPLEKSLSTNIFAMGYITYDANQINTISAKVSGRIEKLYVKYKYQPISKGQRLMDIYSKDLETEQQNLLFLLKNDSENLSLIKASEQKLLLLGITPEQINQIKSSDKTFYAITIYSPYAGHLHDVMQTSIPINDRTGMKNESMTSSTAQELEIKEGMYISKGQTIFNIYDIQKIWAVLNIYPDAQSSIKKGQKIKLEIDGLKDREVEATIDFIEPVIRDNQKNITARVYLNNPSNEIKVGAIVKAKSNKQEHKGLFVPASSIVNLGLNNIVFVHQDGLFKSQKVQTGARSGEWTEIISGISKNDTIAQNGQLLMDSESFIKTENK